jgi:hypothetical protein
VEFTGVELAGGAELAALVEKAAAGPVEKGAAGLRTREGHGRREARWRGRKTGCHALARRRCQSGERSRDGEGGTMERERGGERLAKAARRSVVAESYHGAAVRRVFSFFPLEGLGASR